MKIKIRKTIFRQLIATLGVMILITQTGILDGWTSPNIARSTQPNATIPLTPSQASWLATSFTLGQFASVILVPILIELAGTRKIILYAFVPVSVGWMLIMTATSAMYLYIARFLSGITYTLAYNGSLLYLSEIAMPSLRGTFVSITLTGWCIGAVAASFCESYLSRLVSCTIYLVPCLLGILLFAWLPESSYQMIKDKDPMRAQQSLDWYRGHKQTEAEMKDIIEYVESTGTLSLAEKIKQLKSPVILKAVILVALVRLFPDLCGLYNLIYYMEVILTNGKSFLVDTSDMVIYINFIVLVATVITVNLTDKFGRRTVLLVSISIISLALLGLSLHYYLLHEVKVDPVKIQIIPIASLIVVNVILSIGYVPVMSILFSEMFPSSIRSTAAMIVAFCSNFTAFVSTLAYQFLIDAIGETYLFLIYAVMIASSIPIFVLFMPETKGKSLQEIQNYLNKKN